MLSLNLDKIYNRESILSAQTAGSKLITAIFSQTG